MTAPANSLESLIKQLDSLDARDRLEALEGLRRYVGHRKVDQAIFMLRNDSDRKVRELARLHLAEAEKRTAESLSVVGDTREKEEHLNDLLELFGSSDPTDRVTALKELRTIDHPKAREAVQKAKRDQNRVVRMVAEKAEEDAALDEEKKSKVSRFENGVMVSSPVSGARQAKQGFKERVAGSMAVEFVPFLGMIYLAVSVPPAALYLWMWLTEFGVLDPAMAVDPAVKSVTEKVLQLEVDPLRLMILLTVSLWQAVAGLGVMFRREWGRKSALAWHAAMILFGLLLPSLWRKIIPAAVNMILFYYLTRKDVAETFVGYEKPGGEGGPPSDYGTMERKVW